jgi:hypothetical protein
VSSTRKLYPKESLLDYRIRITIYVWMCECIKGGHHEKDCFDCLTSSHGDSTGLPTTRLLVGSSVARPRGGCWGRGSGCGDRHRRPGVWVLWTTNCLRLRPACIWLPRSGLWVCVPLLRTAVLSQVQILWLLRWKGPLWTPLVDQGKPVFSPALDQKGACDSHA